MEQFEEAFYRLVEFANAIPGIRVAWILFLF